MRTPGWGSPRGEYFTDGEYYDDDEEDLFEKESELGARYYEPIPSPGPYIGGGIGGPGTGRGRPSPRDRMVSPGWEGF